MSDLPTPPPQAEPSMILSTEQLRTLYEEESMMMAISLQRAADTTERLRDENQEKTARIEDLENMIKDMQLKHEQTVGELQQEKARSLRARQLLPAGAIYVSAEIFLKEIGDTEQPAAVFGFGRKVPLDMVDAYTDILGIKKMPNAIWTDPCSEDWDDVDRDLEYVVWNGIPGRHRNNSEDSENGPLPVVNMKIEIKVPCKFMYTQYLTLEEMTQVVALLQLDHDGAKACPQLDILSQCWTGMDELQSTIAKNGLVVPKNDLSSMTEEAKSSNADGNEVFGTEEEKPNASIDCPGLSLNHFVDMMLQTENSDTEIRDLAVLLPEIVHAKEDDWERGIFFSFSKCVVGDIVVHRRGIRFRPEECECEAGPCIPCPCEAKS